MCLRPLRKSRSYLKKVFWPNLGVEHGIQILEILEYSSGLNVAPALILSKIPRLLAGNQNPFFEMASKKQSQTMSRVKTGPFVSLKLKEPTSQEVGSFFFAGVKGRCPGHPANSGRMFENLFTFPLI
jgi:hypothetical protein